MYRSTIPTAVCFVNKRVIETEPAVDRYYIYGQSDYGRTARTGGGS